MVATTLLICSSAFANGMTRRTGLVISGGGAYSDQSDFGFLYDAHVSLAGLFNASAEGTSYPHAGTHVRGYFGIGPFNSSLIQAQAGFGNGGWSGRVRSNISLHSLFSKEKYPGEYDSFTNAIEYPQPDYAHGPRIGPILSIFVEYGEEEFRSGLMLGLLIP